MQFAPSISSVKGLLSSVMGESYWSSVVHIYQIKHWLVQRPMQRSHTALKRP
jgi:hypothetical protein